MLAAIYARKSTDQTGVSNESREPGRQPAHLLRFRHSHGGTGCGSNHSPLPPSRASFSNPSSTVSPGAYFRYHQHQPCLTSS